MGSPGTISLPQGGGAIQGIGETFSPDLFTGTGNFSVPIGLPTGRNGFQPQLNLQYSTGNGNDVFGLGWLLSVPGVSRKTSDGIPRYQNESDVFVLSGAEDLVPISGAFPGTVRYRPRTEGLFARINFHRDGSNSFWVVETKDGLVSTYGTPNSLGNDPAAISDPNELTHIFAWKLTETRDPIGNRIRYEYERDEDSIDESGQLYLRRIQYVDVDVPISDSTGFLVSVDFIYEQRPDPFSTHRSGFPIRTTRRCSRIEVRTHTEISQRVRTYQFVYVDQRVGSSNDESITVGEVSVEPVAEAELPLNGVSQLSQLHVIGHDDSAALPADRIQSLPPLELSYSRFNPERRDLSPLSGRDLPAQALSAPDLDLVDLFGSGLPDFIEMNGTVRYWRNLGGGHFDLPRLMNEAPAGISFADASVQLIDANGDGRTDLLVSKPDLSGYYPLRFGGYWDQRSFQRYSVAPSFDLEGAEVRLVDLNGDGVTDAIRTDNRLEFYFNDPREGWNETRRVDRRPPAEFPDVHFADSRVRLADMSGDGLQDIVLVHEGNIEYWPNLGHGNWGARVHMNNSPRLPFGYDPRQVLVGDVDGDGAADLIFVDDGKIVLWINQSGNGWSDPIEIDGTPGFTNEDDVRLVDLLGTGVAGVLWSHSPLAGRRERGFFLDFTRGVKPYLLNRVNNHRGAITEVGYRSSTEEYLRDQAHRDTRWKTTLPFPVQVVSKVISIDEFSRGRLTTEYRYHHGYWDGGEREYRGFGCVEALNSESFEDYYAPGNDDSFERIAEAHFSPPTLTRSWFHLGPVGDEFGEWDAVNHDEEYWSGDSPFFAEQRTELAQFLASLERRRNRRDALRALRGNSLRTELYALDDSARADRPYTVTESVFGLREIDESQSETNQRHRIFFPHLLGQRTTQWERGDDPLTQIIYTADYDEYGQPRRQLRVACPRGWRDFETDSRPGTDYLTTYAETSFAQRDDDLYIVDRAAGSTTFRIYPQDQLAPNVTASLLRNQAFNGSAPRELIGQTSNYFDGEAFNGLPLGQLGPFGVVSRTETLIATEAILAEAYQSDDPDAPPLIPPYLIPSGEITWPEEYPERFRQAMPPLAGYHFNPGDADHERGYFVDSTRNRFDFQSPGVTNPRGMVRAQRDPLHAETSIEHDGFALLPVRVTDPAGLVTIARDDYRVMQPDLVTEPNGNRTAMTFTALGLLNSIAVMGKEDEPAVGDTLETPSCRFEYDLLAYDNSSSDNRQPVSVRAIRRLHHVSDTHIGIDDRDETNESIEYSDGFGRLLQKRVQAEDILFGNDVFGNDTLSPDQNDVVATQALLVGHRRSAASPPNVIVSGWQVYDNKGKVVQTYEPFFDTGWDYLTLEGAEGLREQGLRNLFGQSVRHFYDPRGQVVRTINPDGSEQRVIFGVPPDLADPDNFVPTPWATYTYDANDLASLSSGPDVATLTDRAPLSHHFTPSSIEIDALGRTLRSIRRNGLGLENQIETSSTYDIRGNILTVVDALGRTAFSYIYDLGNNPVRVHSIDAGIKRTVINAVGLAVEQHDSKGALSLNTYDSLNRLSDLWSRDDSLQRVALRQHVVYGDNATEIGMDQTEARLRNALGEVVTHYDTAGREVIDSYDFKSNLLEKSRQLVSDEEILSVFEGAAANNWTIPAFSVDWESQGTSIDERAAAILEGVEYSTSIQYDALNRVIEVAYPQDVENERRILRQSYNRAGALESITLNGDIFVEQIVYNARGQRTLIAYGNGVMSRCAYDSHTFRPTRLRSERYSHPDDSNYLPTGLPLQDLSYAHDLIGNVVTIRDRTPDCGIPNTPLGTEALDLDFTYDPVYRLISAPGRECDIRPALPPWLDEPRCTDVTRTRAYTEQYQYDAADNMLVLQHQNVGGGFTRQFALTSENNHLETMTIGQSDFAYSYDDAGNLIQETTSRHFEWDFANRMKVFRTQTEGSEPSVYASYLYDAAGMRLKKLVRRQGGQFLVTTCIDGVFEHHRQITGATTEENNTVHVMDHKRRAALRRVGQAFVNDGSPAVQFQLSDYLGSANVVVDNEGVLINREEYTPYGETSFGSFARKRYRFSGKEKDEESGLSYFGARYYAPSLTRWTAADPIGFEGGMNLYTYARNAPTTFVDHAGLAPAPAAVEEEPEATDTTESDTVQINEDTEAVFELEEHSVTQTGWAELREAPGIKPNKKKSQWGLTDTIDAIERVAKEFVRRHPGYTLRIGDISKKGGGELKPHKSHQIGIDVDVKFVFKDPKTIDPKATIDSEDYSQELTQELITLFHTHSTLPVEIIWFADPKVETRGPKQAPRTELSENDKAHRRHFHVRFEHPTLGKTSGGTPRPRAKPLDRPYTGPIGIQSSGIHDYPNSKPDSNLRPYLGPEAVEWPPHLRL